MFWESAFSEFKDLASSQPFVSVLQAMDLTEGIVEGPRPKRRPAVVQRDDFVPVDKAASLRVKTKPLPAAKKRKAMEGPEPNREAEQRGKKLKKVDTAPVEQPVQVSMKAFKDQKLEELEESIIEQAFKPKVKLQPAKKFTKVDPEEFKSQAAAQTFCLADASQVCPDWSLPGAACIGQLCKVYWDGENVWFYARILNFNPSNGRHFVSANELLFISFHFCSQPAHNPSTDLLRRR